jgi:uncharacterized protein
MDGNREGNRGVFSGRGVRSGLRGDLSELPLAPQRRSRTLFWPRNQASEARGVTSVGSDARFSIPDSRSLVAAVLESSTGKDSSLHGESHWQRVAAAGLALLPETPDADPALVFLFALFHDSMRLNDDHDPLHGSRGAALARDLRGEAFDLEDAEMDLLAFACEEHTNGGVDSHPSVGVCWDADRLNLWRVGIAPVPRLLSTGAARRGERISWARGLQREHLAWEDLYRDFGLG